MIVLGKWRIVELPGYEDDYATIVEPACILFENSYSGFSFGCVIGAFTGEAGRRSDRAAMMFDWKSNDEMNPVYGS